MQVDHRGFDESVTELFLDGQQVSASVKHVGGERMTEQVRPNPFRNPGAPRYYVNELGQILTSVGAAFNRSDKQAIIYHARPAVNVFYQGFYTHPGYAGQPVLAPLTITNAYDLTAQIDISNPQVAQLLATQARVCEQRENGSLPYVLRRVDDQRHFGFGERASNKRSWFFRTPQFNRAFKKLHVAFEGKRSVDDVAVRSAFLSHRTNVLVNVLRAWIETQHRGQASNGLRIAEHRDFGEPTSGNKILRKVFEKFFHMPVIFWLSFVRGNQSSVLTMVNL
jgi:hypothetical protein